MGAALPPAGTAQQACCQSGSGPAALQLLWCHTAMEPQPSQRPLQRPPVAGRLRTRQSLSSMHEHSMLLRTPGGSPLAASLHWGPWAARHRSMSLRLLLLLLLLLLSRHQAQVGLLPRSSCLAPERIQPIKQGLRIHAPQCTAQRLRQSTSSWSRGQRVPADTSSSEAVPCSRWARAPLLAWQAGAVAQCSSLRRASTGRMPSRAQLGVMLPTCRSVQGAAFPALPVPSSLRQVRAASGALGEAAALPAVRPLQRSA